MNEFNKIDWDKLQTFKFLVDSGSTTGTARLLGVSPSTISRRISSLEKDLDLSLFYKTGSRLVLTEEGHQIYEVASSMNDQAGRLKSIAEKDQVSGVVSITCVSSMFSEVLAQSLPGLLSRHPAIRISILSTDSNKSISSHEADIAIRLGPSSSESLVSTRVGQIGLSVYSGPGDRVTESRLFNEEVNWIAYNEEFMDVPEMRWMKRHMKRRNPILRTTSGAGYAAAIANNIGVGILPIYRESKFHPLHAVLQSRNVVSRDIWVVTLPLHALSKPSRIVLNWIKDLLAALA